MSQQKDCSDTLSLSLFRLLSCLVWSSREYGKWRENRRKSDSSLSLFIEDSSVWSRKFKTNLQTNRQSPRSILHLLVNGRDLSLLRILFTPFQNFCRLSHISVTSTSLIFQCYLVSLTPERIGKLKRREHKSPLHLLKGLINLQIRHATLLLFFFLVYTALHFPHTLSFLLEITRSVRPKITNIPLSRII